MTAIRLLIQRYAISVITPLLLTVVLRASAVAIATVNIALFYQLTILAVAITAGLGPSIITVILSVLAFHFFFVPPFDSFSVESREDLLRLGIFLVVAISTSGLASRARTAARAAQQRSAELATLYQMSQLIGAQHDLDEILPIVAQTTCQLLRVPSCAVSLYGADGVLYEHTRYGVGDPHEHEYIAPLRDGALILGHLQVAMRAPGQSISTHEQQLLETLAAHASLAVKRTQFVMQAIHTEALAQSDRLKSALIASVSHDLRTPLAAIKGAVSTLLLEEVRWDLPTQHGLIQTIDREADHLNRVVRNLLAMSRIEADALQLDQEWQDIAELIGVVLQRLAALLQDRSVTVRIAPDLPLIWVNATLFDHVLTNLIENALKYTPSGSPFVVTATSGAADTESAVTLTVRDYGPGIIPDQLDHVFEKFYRASPSGSRANGSGLGLAICKGIVEAHGGMIWAQNAPDGGALFTIVLPLPEHAHALYDLTRTEN